MFFSAETEDCKIVNETGTLERMYVGKKNSTQYNNPCLNWAEMDHVYTNSSMLGNHNYCRKPYNDGLEDFYDEEQEWCFTEDGPSPCRVVTCDKYVTVEVVFSKKGGEPRDINTLTFIYLP